MAEMKRKDGLFPLEKSMSVHKKARYHISDMIPVALPPRVAGDGLKDPCSYFV